MGADETVSEAESNITAFTLKPSLVPDDSFNHGKFAQYDLAKGSRGMPARFFIYRRFT